MQQRRPPQHNNRPPSALTLSAAPADRDAFVSASKVLSGTSAPPHAMAPAPVGPRAIAPCRLASLRFTAAASAVALPACCSGFRLLMRQRWPICQHCAPWRDGEAGFQLAVETGPSLHTPSATELTQRPCVASFLSRHSTRRDPNNPPQLPSCLSATLWPGFST